MIFSTTARTILAVAVVVLLLFFSIRIFSAVFNRGDETAKSYMEILKEEIDEVDKGKDGEFFMWYVDGREGEKDFYIVYFGKALEVEIEKQLWISGVPSQYKDVNVSFNSFGRNDNRICICYTSGNERQGYDTSCEHCEDLDHPAVFTGKTAVEGTWIEEGGDRISIKLKGDQYVFSKIQ